MGRKEKKGKGKEKDVVEVVLEENRRIDAGDPERVSAF